MSKASTWLLALWLVGCRATAGSDDRTRVTEREPATRASLDAAIGELSADGGPDGGEPAPDADGGGADANETGGAAGAGASGAAPDGAGAAGRDAAVDPATGGTTAEAPDFAVASHEPSDGATLDDVDQPLAIEFSSNLDAASVTNETIAVTRSSQRVPGRWAVTGKQAVFTPSLPWALAGSFEVALTDGVRSVDARPLTAARFGFQVRDGRWTAETIGPAWNRTDVSVAHTGNAAVVWADLTDTWGSGGVYLKTWKPGVGWSTPARLSVETTQVLSPSVAINDAGSVAVAYSFTVAAFVRGSLDETTWTEPAYLGAAGGREISRPDFVLNAEGRAFGVVSTYHVSPEITSVDGNLLELQTGMLTPYPVSNREGGIDSGAQLALYRGKPLVVWQEGGTQPGVWLMENAPEGVRLQLSAAGAVTETPAVAAADESDSVIAAWVQTDDTVSSIWAARRTGDAPFEPPQKVSTGTSSARTPSLAIDAEGRALVVWEQDADAESVQVYAAEFTPEGNTWTSPEAISVPSVRAVRPSVVREPGGNAIAAWVQSEVLSDDAIAAAVYAARFVDSGWQAADRKKLESSDYSAINNLSLGMDGSGRTVLSWVDGAGIHLGRFD